MDHQNIPDQLWRNANTLTLLETALLTLKDGIAVLSRDGIVQYINASAQLIAMRSYGTAPETGSYFFDYIKDETQSMRARASFERAFTNESSERKVQFYFNGKEFWFRMGYHPMPKENGTVVHVCATAKDITEEILLERKLTLQQQIQKNEVIRAALEAQEKERSFIGRELHDNVNQVLTTVRLYLDLGVKQEVIDRDLISKTLQHVDYCINEIRKLSHKLDAYELPEPVNGSLVDGLHALVASINETKKVSVNFFYHGINKLEIHPELQQGIYRVVQEQLTNILKHACASLVDLFIVGTSVSISLRISDNGSGFNMETVKNGSGINGMMTRVGKMNGYLHFDTSPGEGCTLNVRIPLQQPAVQKQS